jgi:hypothetical protein
MSKGVVPIGFLVLALTALSGETGSAEDARPSVAKLIEQLGSDGFEERERATQLLRERGPSVLPALRKASSHPDAEVRRRVLELIPALELAATLAPKRLTLSSHKQPLSAMLAEIKRQTGYSIITKGDDEKKLYDLELKDVTLWQAVERISLETGYVVEEGSHGMIRLKRCESRSPYVSLDGPFRVELKEFCEYRERNFKEATKLKPTGRRAAALVLYVSIEAEPRLAILHTEAAIVGLALDEDKKSMARPDWFEKGDLMALVYQLPGAIQLQRASETARTLKHLRGRIPVTLLVERRRVVVSDKLLDESNKKVGIGDTTIEFESATKNSHGNYEVKIVFPKDTGAIEPRWSERIHLEDAKGNAYRSLNSYGNETLSTETRTWTFKGKVEPDVDPPSKLILENWITLRHSIPFEFKDVPLP